MIYIYYPSINDSVPFSLACYSASAFLHRRSTSTDITCTNTRNNVSGRVPRPTKILFGCDDQGMWRDRRAWCTPPPPPRRKACSCCCWPAASSTGGGGESRLNSALACNTSLARVINSRVRSACNAACPRVLCTRKAAAGFEMRAVRQIQPSGRRPVTCG